MAPMGRRWPLDSPALSRHAAAMGYQAMRQAARRHRMAPSAFVRLALQQVLGQFSMAGVLVAPPPRMRCHAR